MDSIKNVIAREILDSRGNPTIEVDVTTNSNVVGRFSVPSGASTGEHEAVEKRDASSNRFFGKGVLGTVQGIHNVIAPQIRGIKIDDQERIDSLMIALDGTKNKSNLGANAILGVSIACAKAASLCAQKSLFEYVGLGNGVTLPTPMMNIINGGAHADNGLDVQEFMIVPYGQTTYSEALRCGIEIFQTLKAILKKKGLSTSVGDEGGFAPRIGSNEEVLSVICEAIERAGYRPGEDVGLALDVAASEFYARDSGKYLLRDKGLLSSDEMVRYYDGLIQQFPIVSIEDPLDQNDWNGFQALTKAIGDKIQIVGDDLFVTSEEKLGRAIKEKIANAILIKPNQVGSLTETLRTVKSAQKSQYGVIFSHRSGETEDTTIADLAVATNAGQIKTGSLSRTDRLAKYNQLLRIEEQLGARAQFLGRKVF